MDLNKFDPVSFKVRTHCAICGRKLDKAVIDLPGFPLTEIYVKEKVTKRVGFVDQEFHLCENCGHGQLRNIIDPEFLYGAHYSTRTSISPSASLAIQVFLDFIDTALKGRKFKTILEIGCNDLYTLQKLRDRADQLFGIDPILKGREGSFKDKKIKIFGDLFENISLEDIGCEPDVVLSSHTLEHIGEPKELIRKLLDRTGPETLFFFQFPGLEMLVQEGRFDQIHHQHISYFSLRSVIRMLETLGAELMDFKMNPYHWGTLMVAFRKKRTKGGNPEEKFKHSIKTISRDLVQQQYQTFKDCMGIASKRITALHHETIYGYGAALMLPVLDYHMQGLRQLKNIIDDDREKKDLYYLNFPVQIKLPRQVGDIKDAVIVVTAINSLETQRAILRRLIDLKVRQILVPLNLI